MVNSTARSANRTVRTSTTNTHLSIRRSPSSVSGGGGDPFPSDDSPAPISRNPHYRAAIAARSCAACEISGEGNERRLEEKCCPANRTGQHSRAGLLDRQIAAHSRGVVPRERAQVRIHARLRRRLERH